MCHSVWIWSRCFSVCKLLRHQIDLKSLWSWADFKQGASQTNSTSTKLKGWETKVWFWCFTENLFEYAGDSFRSLLLSFTQCSVSEMSLYYSEVWALQDTKKKKSKMCTQQVVVQRTSADGAEGGRLWMNEEVKACRRVETEEVMVTNDFRAAFTLLT